MSTEEEDAMGAMYDYRHVAARGVLGGVRIERAEASGTLVLVHGAGHDHHALVPLARAISRFDVLLLDLPGRGLSTLPAATSVVDVADALAGILEDRALRAPILFGGHSLGGAVVIELALRHTLPGLVLLSTGARLRVSPHILEDARAVCEGTKSRARDLGYGPDVAPSVREALELAFDRVPPASTLADWTMANGFDRLNDVSAITCPTLIVHGDADPYTPLKYAEHLARAIPLGALVRIEGGSHMAVVERAEEVAAAIDARAS